MSGLVESTQMPASHSSFKNEYIASLQIVKICNWQEIEEMIVTVDKNKDGKINYSEFRVGFANEMTKMTSYKFDREKELT